MRLHAGAQLGEAARVAGVKPSAHSKIRYCGACRPGRRGRLAAPVPVVGRAAAHDVALVAVDRRREVDRVGVVDRGLGRSTWIARRKYGKRGSLEEARARSRRTRSPAGSGSPRRGCGRSAARACSAGSSIASRARCELARSGRPTRRAARLLALCSDAIASLASRGGVRRPSRSARTDPRAVRGSRPRRARTPRGCSCGPSRAGARACSSASSTSRTRATTGKPSSRVDSLDRAPRLGHQLAVVDDRVRRLAGAARAPRAGSDRCGTTGRRGRASERCLRARSQPQQPASPSCISFSRLGIVSYGLRIGTTMRASGSVSISVSTPAREHRVLAEVDPVRARSGRAGAGCSPRRSASSRRFCRSRPRSTW